jgi:hypothetical protein
MLFCGLEMQGMEHKKPFTSGSDQAITLDIASTLMGHMETLGKLQEQFLQLQRQQLAMQREQLAMQREQLEVLRSLLERK